MYTKSTVRVLSLAVAVIFISFFSLKCSTDEEDSSSGYKVGLILPQTGDLAQLGEPKMNAFQIAAEEVNNDELEGNNVEISFGDNRGQPKEGVSVMQRMTSVDGIRTFYMDITAVALASTSIADDNESIMFAGSAHPTITEKSEWVFRVFTSGRQEARKISNYLSENGVNSIYIYNVDDPLGHDTRSELVDRFTESGGEIAGTDSYPISGQQFRSVLTKMRDSEADKIVMLGYGVAIPKILRQASEIGIAGDRIVGNIGFVGPNVFGLDPEVTEGAVFTGPAFTYRLRRDSLSGDTKEFVSEYRNRYGESPDYTAAFAYDALKIIARAVNNSDDTPNKVRKSLLKIKDYEGVTGGITILDNGDSRTDMIVGRFENGKIVRVEN